MFAGEFDLLLVWSLDRFSREGLAGTVGYLPRLASHGVAGSPAGKKRSSRRYNEAEADPLPWSPSGF